MGSEVGGIEVSVEREACWSWLLKETDDVGISWVAACACDFKETPVVISGAVS